MFRNSYQHSFLTIFFSCGSKPLGMWDVHVKDGSIDKFMDDDIKSTVLDIRGNNVSTTYITCPKGNAVLGIFMPFMVMIVKNLKQYFSFEVTILDDSRTRRRFRISNFQSTSQVLPLSTAMPIGLNDGWNQIQFDLARFTLKAYKRQFIEVQKVKINANIRLRRIYFTRHLVPDEELPAEFKLFFPLSSKGKGRKGMENIAPLEKALQEVVKEKSVLKVSQSKEQQQEQQPKQQPEELPPAPAAITQSSEKVAVKVIKSPSQEKSETKAVNVGEEVPSTQREGLIEEEKVGGETGSDKTSRDEIGSGEGIGEEQGVVEVEQEETAVADVEPEKEAVTGEEPAEVTDTNTEATEIVPIAPDDASE